MDPLPNLFSTLHLEATCEAVEATTNKANLYTSFLKDDDQLHVMAQALEESTQAYQSKKTLKRKPRPKERYMRDMKRIRPAKVALAGPDFEGVTSVLQQLKSQATTWCIKRRSQPLNMCSALHICMP